MLQYFWYFSKMSTCPSGQVSCKSACLEAKKPTITKTFTELNMLTIVFLKVQKQIFLDIFVTDIFSIL